MPGAFDEHVQREKKAQKAIDADFHPCAMVVGATASELRA